MKREQKISQKIGGDPSEEMNTKCVDLSFSQRDIRSLAFHLIYAMEQFDYTISLEALVDNFRRGYDLDIPADSPAIRIARLAIDKRNIFDEELIPFLKNWKLERLGCCTRLILRLSLSELSQPEAIPTVIINEAIELAKSFAERDAYKFVNGVLDEIIVARGLKKKKSERVEDLLPIK